MGKLMKSTRKLLQKNAPLWYQVAVSLFAALRESVHFMYTVLK